MSCFAGPNISTNNLVLSIDAANTKSYDSAENLYLTSEDLTSFLSNVIGGTYTTSTTGGPFNGKYAIISVTNTNHYLFEWGNSISLTTGTTVTQSWYVRPVTNFNTIYLRFWPGTNRPWSSNAFALFNISATSVISITGEISTATIQQGPSNWIRISATAVTTSSGFSAFSLYGSIGGVVSTTTVYHVAGPQLVKKSDPGPYTPTTGAAIAASTTWNDQSTNKNNGSLINGALINFSNLGGMSFDGVDDYISFGSNPTLTDQITVEVWTKLSDPQGPNSSGLILGRENSYRLLYSFGAIDWVCATVNNAWYTAGTVITTGTVNPFLDTLHIVGTYNGANLKLYINGVLRTTGANISGNILTSGSYYLARTTAGNVDYGQGIIYSNKIYNRALTDDEIAKNFNALRGRFGL